MTNDLIEIHTYFMRLLDFNNQNKYEYSNYWAEEVESLKYLSIPNIEILKTWRHHMFWITGDLVYNYKNHHVDSKRHQQMSFRFNKIRETYKSHEFIYEPKNLGGFGYELGEGLVNIDTIKFNESLIALNSTAKFSDKEKEYYFLEVGSGYGGMAHALRATFPRAKIFLIDLKEVLFTAAVYLSDLYPKARIGILENSDSVNSLDIILCPAGALEILDGIQFDAMLNICSFQEMTSQQVIDYAKFAGRNNIPLIYSHNRNYGPYNKQIESVEACIKKIYKECIEVKIFPTDYTHLYWKDKTQRRKILQNRYFQAKKERNSRKRPILKSNQIPYKKDRENFYRHNIFELKK